MSVKIRLQRHGRKQTPLYHIVIADARAPRDGSFIERIGTYNPMTRPATIEIDRMKAYEWMTNGAQPTETVRAILRHKGVLFYKHLQRGVAKGAMSAEDAEVKFTAWVDEKEARIADRVQAAKDERKEKAAQISGTKKSAKKKEAVTQDDDELLNVDLASSAAAETAADADVVEESTPVTETTEETAPVAETTEETSAPAETKEEASATSESAEESTTTEETADTASEETADTTSEETAETASEETASEETNEKEA